MVAMCVATFGVKLERLPIIDLLEKRNYMYGLFLAPMSGWRIESVTHFCLQDSWKLLERRACFHCELLVYTLELLF